MANGGGRMRRDVRTLKRLMREGFRRGLLAAGAGRATEERAAGAAEGALSDRVIMKVRADREAEEVRRLTRADPHFYRLAFVLQDGRRVILGPTGRVGWLRARAALAAVELLDNRLGSRGGLAFAAHLGDWGPADRIAYRHGATVPVVRAELERADEPVRPGDLTVGGGPAEGARRADRWL
jgi:hypothetical protein